MGWWLEAQPGLTERVVLFQIDLSGHSKWIAQHQPTHQACALRTLLADQFTNWLARLGYPRVFWAGDGGLFARKFDGQPQQVCDAADQVFECFEQRDRSAAALKLRITATLTHVHIDPSPGHWCSPTFNAFLKYERLISVANGFVITHDLRNELRSRSDLARFPRPRRVRLPDGEQLIVYDDQHYRNLTPASFQSFGAWLANGAEAPAATVTILPDGLTRIGQCSVLHSSSDPDGYDGITLEPLQPLDPASGVRPEHVREWAQHAEVLRAAHVSGTVMSVSRFIPPISDDHCRLQYRVLDYASMRAFHKLLEAQGNLVSLYRSAALDVLRVGTSIPNSLSIGIVTIIGDADPQLVIAHRKERPGGYDANTWAVSIGEQVMPVTGTRGKRTISADSSIEAAATRGLEEELLGHNYDGPLRFAVHAFYLEDFIDNFCFLAIADLRPLPFSLLAELWARAEDQGEHDAIAAIPLAPDTLEACLGNERLPAFIWDQAQSASRVALSPGIQGLPDSEHMWQRNAHIRLAAALWWAKPPQP